MNEIARAAGVSIATVSLCLRNNPRFPPETCKRIQKIAADLGYKPNPLISTLMAHVRANHPPEYTATIGFINAYPVRGYAKVAPTCKRYFEGARLRAEQIGYQLNEIWVHEPGMTPQRLNKVLYSTGVTGLVIGAMPFSQAQLSFDWPNVSVAVIGHSLWGVGLHRAAHDQFRAIRLVMRQLNELGYRRAALTMTTDFDKIVDHNWLAGMLVDQNLNPDDPAIPALITPAADRMTPSVDRAAFTKWFKRHRPDVVISPHTESYQFLKDMGLRIPEDVGFVLLDWSPPVGDSMAGVDQRSEIIGASAVDIVIGQLQRNERGFPSDPKLVLIGGVWVNGASVRKVS